VSEITQAVGLEDLTLNVTQEVLVKAPIEITFEALLEQLGPAMDTPEGTLMHGKLEPWPGGRWYRDLGENNGHFWAHVQAIKRPALLELCGPLFMSYPVSSNLQYRLSEVPGGTLIKFHHKALGLIDPQHREGVGKGWTHFIESARKRAEAAARKR
jgi:uncharacterized protein YndB with AHSA1/START domain